MTPCGEATFGNVVMVRLSDHAMAARGTKIQSARREIYMSSSCGLCGKQTLDRIEQEIPPIRGDFKVPGDVLDELPGKMRKAQEQPSSKPAASTPRRSSPRRHAARRRCVRTIGRHNAVDKVVGWAVLEHQTPIDPAVLLVSGRSSFEIMQKAAMAGIAFVAAVSAPSSLAVDFAVRMKMTLVGFLRPGRMNVYHDAGRIAS